MEKLKNLISLKKFALKRKSEKKSLVGTSFKASNHIYGTGGPDLEHIVPEKGKWRG